MGYLTALFLSWTFLLGPTMRQSDMSSMGGVVAVAHPFGDVVIVVLLVLLRQPLAANSVQGPLS